MALPTIDTPRYELTLPSSDVQVQYRPFVVKEEKILMMAMETKENNGIITASSTEGIGSKFEINFKKQEL